MDFVPKERYGIGDLLDIVERLRRPDGCPWDREQTHESIRNNLIEETYEVAEAIDTRDSGLLCEELGDLLLQIALHAQMEQEEGRFTFEDVCDGICKKLIYRHPHVFGELGGDLSSGQVLQNWEALKNTEKGRETAADRLGSVPASLPGPMRAAKLQKRADAFGFGYGEVQGAVADMDSEVAELKQALADGEGVRHEVGDVLFSAVNVARMAGIDAEEALGESSTRFATRVIQAERLAGRQGIALEQADAEQLDALWKQAKKLDEN